MPPAKRDCGLVIFDLKSKKKDQLLTGLIKFATFKWFSSSKDLYRLILSNSKTTKNEKNISNLYTTEIEDFNPRNVLEHIENSQAQEGNWLDALLLAIYHLKEATSMSGLVTLQLLFFTSLDTNEIIDENKLQSVIKEINENKIYLYIMGPTVKLPSTIKHPEDVQQCMKGLIVDESNKSLVAARRIVQNIEKGVLCDVKVGINLIHFFKKSRGSLPWKVPMTFSSQLEIASISVKIYKREWPLRLVPNHYRRFTRVLAEDQTIEVKNEEIVRGILRHGKFVKVDDRDMFKMETSRCFDILGFTDQTFVPETYIRGEENLYVLPDHELVDDSCQAFYNLVSVLANQNKYGIVKRVHMSHARARYFVLIPQPDMRPVCFLMVGLPYADDVMSHECETPTPSKVKGKEDEFTRFFRSIDIFNKEPKVEVPLSPTMMMHPYLNKLVNSAATKVLKRDFDFESVELDDFSQEETNKFVENLRHSWPVRD
ncbi:hypothetical protein JTB14_009044 [Gonioctena quinquepunctata]|nr:hypothetical protein JTB14_009044 [Gonioctena quinquepunctata]